MRYEASDRSRKVGVAGRTYHRSVPLSVNKIKVSTYHYFLALTRVSSYYDLSNVISTTHIAESVNNIRERKDCARLNRFYIAFLDQLESLRQQSTWM